MLRCFTCLIVYEQEQFLVTLFILWSLMRAFYLTSHAIIIIAQIHMTYYYCDSIKQNKTSVIILCFAKPFSVWQKHSVWWMAWIPSSHTKQFFRAKWKDTSMSRTIMRRGLFINIITKRQICLCNINKWTCVS